MAFQNGLAPIRAVKLDERCESKQRDYDNKLKNSEPQTNWRLPTQFLKQKARYSVRGRRGIPLRNWSTLGDDYVERGKTPTCISGQQNETDCFEPQFGCTEMFLEKAEQIASRQFKDFRKKHKKFDHGIEDSYPSSGKHKTRKNKHTGLLNRLRGRSINGEGLGNLAVFQPSCFLLVAWQLGTERVLQLNDYIHNWWSGGKDDPPNRSLSVSSRIVQNVCKPAVKLDKRIS
ncbi:hypothetical protein CLF_107977 [Clonorchis sinensis]|uniref:Uncharacterized protein n=1 Tax=Clonorchis sinensis TaxID=79923 RepID=G7YHF7_CLOSI|nr:hypothetical protein CLF_107977 [Clonorchis sinensis]